VEFLEFNNISGPRMFLNNSGKIAFNASYFDPLENTAAATNSAFDAMNSDLSSNGDDIGPTNNNNRPVQHGIWTEENGRLKLLAKVGDLAPEDGRHFLNVDPAAMNNAGQVVIFGLLKKRSFTEEAEAGIWVQDPQGKLRLVIKTGQLLDVAPGPETDIRTVSSWHVPFYPLEGTFNDHGQLALNVIFTDGTEGGFIAQVGAIPEPQRLASALGSAIAFAFFRRTRRRPPS
jgi:hypothetical protein